MTDKVKKLFIITAAVLGLSSCMIKTEKKIRTVSVSGTGVVEIANKEATLVLSVVSRDEDVIKAADDNAAKMGKIMTSIYECGIGEDSVYTSDYSIRQETSEQNIRGKITTVISYVVSNRLHVLVKNVESTGKIIDAAIKAGANQVNNLSFSAGNTKEEEKQARILAIRDAEQKAQTLVSTSGLVLGQVESISEREGYARYDNAPLFASKAMATPISSGTTSVCVTVDITYKIEN